MSFSSSSNSTLIVATISNFSKSHMVCWKTMLMLLLVVIKFGFDMRLRDEHGHFIQVKISKFGNRLSVPEW